MITVSLVYRQRKPPCVRNNSDITAARPGFWGERLQGTASVLAGMPGVAVHSRPDLLAGASGLLAGVSGFWPASRASGRRLGATGRRLGAASQVPGVT